ncbi:MAG: type II toxin-antitoxin system HicB family antitoxin [Mesorhizobium sp.]|nr:type II toxin-antitoxin system HicB family antitoxin [Mesorhizobium sp.]
MDYVFMARFVAEPDGGFLVSFPDVPEAITQGEDMRDAFESATDALGVALRGRLADQKAIPEPMARGKSLIAVPVDAETALKIALIEAFAASGLSKVEFARRLGKSPNEPYRILDPDHPTKLGVLKDALAVLGKQVVVSVRDAA